MSSGNVHDLLDKYDAGQLSRGELLRRLAGLRYEPTNPSGMDGGGAPDFPQLGTLEEVQAAAVVGRLTEDEMDAIVTEVLRTRAQIT
jgi:hypothetical protein